MKKILSKKNILHFIVFMMLVLGGYKTSITVTSDSISDVYHSLNVSDDTVLSGQELDVTIRLNNIESIPSPEKSIQSYISFLQYDHTKFTIPTTGEISPDGFTNLDENSYEIGVYSQTISLPGQGDISYEDKPYKFFARINEKYPGYIFIEILFSTEETNVLREDYDVATFTFVAKENVSGVASFNMHNSVEDNQGGYNTYLGTEVFEINNTIAQANVHLISGNADIAKIKVIDIDTNIEYIAKKTGVRYEVAVLVDTLHIIIEVIPESPSAIISGSGQFVFDEEFIEYLITVEADDSTTTNEFNLLVRRESTVNTINRIELINSELLNGNNHLFLNSETNDYTLDVKNTDSLIIIFHPTEGSNSIIFYEGIQRNSITLENLEENSQVEIKVSVEAENKNIREYTFLINILPENQDTSVEYLKTTQSDNVTGENNQFTITHEYSDINKVQLIVKSTNPHAEVSFGNSPLGFIRVAENDNYYYISDEIELLHNSIKQYILIITSGSKTAEYTVNLEFQGVDQETRLEKIYINGYELANFNPNKYQYSIGEFQYDTGSIAIEATTLSNNATVSGVGEEVILLEGANVIILTVTSQRGYYGETPITQHYYLSYFKSSALSDKTTVDRIVIDGNTLVDFNNDIKNYSLVVPYSKANMTIEAYLSEESVGALLEGNLGYQEIHVGENILIVKVISQSKLVHDEFIITVTREAMSSNADIERVYIDDVEINESEGVYLYQVKYNTNVIYLSAVACEHNAIISGTGRKELIVGENEFIIEIQSQDESQTNQYVVKIYREAMSNDTSISKVYINGIEIPLINDQYSYNVGFDSEIIDLEVIPFDVNAQAIGDGLKLLNFGENEFVITIIAQDEVNIKDYVIKVTREHMGTDTTIKNIYVDGKIIELFDNKFVHHVGFNTNLIDLQATAADENAGISGTGLKSLKLGQNVFKIIVTSHDQAHSQEYFITIVRENPSSNGKLRILKIDGVEIKDFNENQFSYTYTVGWEVLSIVLYLETSDDNAIILPQKTNKFEQQLNLNFGLNTFSINIQAEDDSITTYQLIVTRQTIVNKDSSLKELQIEGYDPFKLRDGDERITVFNLIVPHSQEEVKVKASTTSPNAMLVGATTHSLNYGVNQIDVVVFAEDKSSTIYRIFVFRESVSNNNFINKITIQEVPDFKFEQNIEVYYINLDDKVNNFNFEIETAHNESSYEVIGNNNFKVGVNPIEIKVTAVDGSVRSYLIFVTIQPLQEPTPNKNTSTGLVIGIILTSTISLGSVGYIVLNIVRRRG